MINAVCLLKGMTVINSMKCLCPDQQLVIVTVIDSTTAERFATDIVLLRCHCQLDLGQVEVIPQGAQMGVD